jgi:hypothetical protein
MFKTMPHAQPATPKAPGFVPRTGFSARTINRLERANFSRDSRLLAASIAGIVLSTNPQDLEMRQKAARAWGTIRALLADHLFTEEPSALPWGGYASMGSPTSYDILKKRYCELRQLARTVGSVSFDDGSDEQISSAGKSLCELSVKLDDLMEVTERRLVNTLRQYVFASAQETVVSA